MKMDSPHLEPRGFTLRLECSLQGGCLLLLLLQVLLQSGVLLAGRLFVEFDALQRTAKLLGGAFNC